MGGNPPRRSGHLLVTNTGHLYLFFSYGERVTGSLPIPHGFQASLDARPESCIKR